MPNVMSALKDEITRLSRKEAKAAVIPLRKPSVAVRKALAALKRRVEALEHEVATLRRACQASAAEAEASPGAEAEPKARITAKTVKALRRKLKLPVTQFAKLVGVTPKWIYMWERKQGPLRMRSATREAILSVRSMGVREAAQRIAEVKRTKKS